ncbi:histidine kinase dimerization/phosphoacceptor domain -containing protein [Desulfonatronum sp. SC1]|uniref:histidine kinase dimerization/phosphoacceptor domain -containing protein n=1 Tax=Desulfonatronum sp. SC1 TaxID=2109626 RepID=UPI001304EEF9|nr:histidine kinase dimerization/phosphoacceptor domain -containing protein [Desulfonatronum sp. SC1]
MPKRIFLLLAVFWTILLVILAGMVYRHAHSTTFDVAVASARDTFSRDLLYRLWAAKKGGLYVHLSPETPPNPYLSHIPDRDIATPSGRQLTLVNPAYMTRQVHELGKDLYGLRGTITGLRPLRPENVPDEWEKEALLAFEQGESEVVSLESMDDELFLRFMRPMFTETGCLKCHAEQGYKVGDIQGGISVSVPWEESDRNLRELRRTMVFAFGPIWLFGMLGLLLARQRIHHHFLARLRTDDALRDSLAEKEMLLREVHHRVKNNLAVVTALLIMQRSNVTDPAGAAALLDLEGRIKSMALVHEKLYHSANLARIDCQDYLETFLQELRQSLDIRGDIRFIADAQGVSLELDMAISCGMIINELVTNAFKYAFPEGEARNGGGDCEIRVAMRAANGRCTLEVVDNGVGIPADVDPLSAQSYGLRLVRMIATHQFSGHIEVDRSEGTRIAITIEAREGKT